MSDKDSYWFRHDASAGRGLKMRKMAHIYSHWGKGVYWDVVEILRDQKNYKFESDESSLQLLCDLVGCKDNAKFISWFRDCIRIGLFKDENGYFTCPPLCKNMVRWETSKLNGSKGGRPRKDTQNKPKEKPKKNPTDNLNNNPKKTIIEEYSIEDNIREYNIRLAESFTFLENLAKNSKKSLDFVNSKLKLFYNEATIRQIEYLNFNKYKDHFANWYLKKCKESYIRPTDKKIAL